MQKHIQVAFLRMVMIGIVIVVTWVIYITMRALSISDLFAPIATVFSIVFILAAFAYIDSLR